MYLIKLAKWQCLLLRADETCQWWLTPIIESVSATNVDLGVTLRRNEACIVPIGR